MVLLVVSGVCMVCVLSLVVCCGIIVWILLVIDNEEVIFEGMCVVLEGWGCDVFMVFSEDEVCIVLVVLGVLVDVIFVDYYLGDGVIGEIVVVWLWILFDWLILVVIIIVDCEFDLCDWLLGVGLYVL